LQQDDTGRRDGRDRRDRRRETKDAGVFESLVRFACMLLPICFASHSNPLRKGLTNAYLEEERRERFETKDAEREGERKREKERERERERE
jgi:hypothetical protein